jgi:hypothetical protein
MAFSAESTFDAADPSPIFGNARKISNGCQVEHSPESFINDFSRTVGMFCWCSKSLVFENRGFNGFFTKRFFKCFGGAQNRLFLKTGVFSADSNV